MNDVESDRNVPRFILGGAMKSGTSTLAEYLRGVPGVYLPPRETFILDADDLLQHPQFLRLTHRSHNWMDLSAKDLEPIRERYRLLYEGVGAPALGDYANTYLPSRFAAERIGAISPSCRAVFVLRDPTDRAYSHYWHLVRNRRVYVPFASLLRTNPEKIVGRGHYLEQVRRYVRVLGQERVHVIIFEALIQDPIHHLRGLHDFLEVPGSSYELPWKNAGRFPTWPALYRSYARLAPGREGRYRGLLGDPEDHVRAVTRRSPTEARRRLARFLGRAIWRPVKPPMPASCRSLLKEYYSAVNDGLVEYCVDDPSEWWT